jgi:glycosyltransferase involved in cell wall biosynthesis
MKILLSAYACEPNRGSEPEAGFQVMLAAAAAHEVWVLTRENNLPALREEVEKRGLTERVHLIGLDVPGRAMSLKNRGLPMLHLYYDIWQRAAAVRAQELDGEVDFDVVHHATFAAFWSRAGVSAVDKPFVWGPVGGGVEPPIRLATQMGVRGVLEDAVRVLVRRLAGRVSPALRQARKRVSVALVQNSETGRRLGIADDRIIVLPNALSVAASIRPDPDLRHRSREILSIGRLIPLKAAALAIRALVHVEAPDATLRFIGDGPERRRIERLARRYGLSDRVTISAWMERRALLTTVNGAGVVLHTALHEEAGMAISEALSLGTPVVCIGHGGPRELIRYWPDDLSVGVVPGSVNATVTALAAGLDRFLAHPPPRPDATVLPSAAFDTEILRAYDSAVTSAAL